MGGLPSPARTTAWGYEVSLTLDGVEVKPDFLELRHVEDPVFGKLNHRVYVFNFPAGLTGTHVFGGSWTGPCDEMVAQGFATGPCTSPNAVVPAAALATTITVTFVP